MQLKFIKEFVKDIYLFYKDNIIINRKSRRIKESFKVFVKYISLLFFVIILIKVIFFSS